MAEEEQVKSDIAKETIKDDKVETEYEKLKSQNDEMEKELVRSREQRSEAQKIEAEKMIGGETGGHVEAEVKEETPKEYSDRIMKNDVGEKKDGDK